MASTHGSNGMALLARYAIRQGHWSFPIQWRQNSDSLTLEAKTPDMRPVLAVTPFFQDVSFLLWWSPSTGTQGCKKLTNPNQLGIA